MMVSPCYGQIAFVLVSLCTLALCQSSQMWPACLQGCLSSTNLGPCATADFDCICGNADASDALSGCISSSCGEIQAAPHPQGFCGAWGSGAPWSFPFGSTTVGATITPHTASPLLSIRPSTSSSPPLTPPSTSTSLPSGTTSIPSTGMSMSTTPGAQMPPVESSLATSSGSSRAGLSTPGALALSITLVMSAACVAVFLIWKRKRSKHQWLTSSRPIPDLVDKEAATGDEGSPSSAHIARRGAQGNVEGRRRAGLDLLPMESTAPTSTLSSHSLLTSPARRYSTSTSRGPTGPLEPRIRNERNPPHCGLAVGETVGTVTGQNNDPSNPSGGDKPCSAATDRGTTPFTDGEAIIPSTTGSRQTFFDSPSAESSDTILVRLPVGLAQRLLAQEARQAPGTTGHWGGSEYGGGSEPLPAYEPPSS
ncbi:hypothetical protein C8Q77DRAFT_707618 [Trametes polyzona]|nr:hypothetical protein C8Q77DRAFT_707618 [Trametes polyzona]